MPTMLKTAKALADEIEGIWDAAERAGRSLTADEREYMTGLVEEAKSQNELERKIAELGGGASWVRTDPNYPNTAGGLHKVAMEDGGAKYDLDNLVSACKPCPQARNGGRGREGAR
jgi:hypothetical protein